MTCPAAAVVHETPGRSRLRVAEKRGDRAYFEAAQRVLSGCPGVRRVSVSPLTGSLLVLHAGELAAVVSFARDRAIFELAAAPLPDTFASIEAEVRRLDTKLRAGSQERWGVAGLTFYGLVGAGLWQLVQGRVLPPTVTLLFQAFNVFKQAREAEQVARARLNERAR
jgi:hypothetical protein